MPESPERAALRELVDAVRPPNLEGDDWPARWRTGGPTASTLQERLLTACEKALALLAQTPEQRREAAEKEFEDWMTRYAIVIWGYDEEIAPDVTRQRIIERRAWLASRELTW